MAARTEKAGSSRGGWTLFRVRGVPVRVDLSFILIAGFAVLLFAGELAEGLRGSGPVVLAVSATVAALLFFASVLAHEFGHAFASLSRGIPVISITLFMLGGVTESASEAKTARDEFVIVGIGPFVSLVLGIVFYVLSLAVAGMSPYDVVLRYLAFWNGALAVFNVLPGYPLDGGRLLRSVLWGVTGQRHGSTRWAARVGQAFALMLIGVALYVFLGLPRGALGVLRFVAGSPIWTGLIGLFLLRGATDSYRRATVSERLAARTVRDIMGSCPPPLDPDTSVGDALGRIQERPSLLWPVGDPITGVVRLADLDAVARDDWPFVTVADVAVDAGGSTIDVGSAVDDALARLNEAPGNMLIVTEAGRPVGLLTPSIVVGVVT